MPRENAIRTRKCLLDAASDIFCQKGFRDATIAEISKRAGTNIAAVNYHFRNKEALYIEAWRCAFQESIKAHPLYGNLSKDAPAEERLRAHISATISRLADKNNKEFWFVQREFANPTGLLEEVMREEVTPLREKTENLVRELLGPHVSHDDVFFCEMSIMNQCINPMVAGNRLPENGKNQSGPPRIKDTKAYTEHVVKFSLAGIKAVRKNAEMKSVKKNKEKEE
ncbi:MAG: CerR family C-terminal domain-containing protein [Smithella sp.]